MTKKDAIRDECCRSCKFFHVPQGDGSIGACVRYPPTVFIVGAAPASPIMDPKNPPAVIHVTKSYYPLVSRDDGCGEYRVTPERMN